MFLWSGQPNNTNTSEYVWIATLLTISCHVSTDLTHFDKNNFQEIQENFKERYIKINTLVLSSRQNRQKKKQSEEVRFC